MRFVLLAALVALAACATPQEPPPPQAPLVTAPAVPAEAPPMDNGIYVYDGCEGEGGCMYRFWRATEQTPIRAAQDPNAAVLATLEPGEWIITETYATRLQPSRGVVQKDTDRFTAGEVVYSLWYAGEGMVAIWRSGEIVIIEYDDPVQIAFDPRPPLPPEVTATLGLWVRAKREKDGVEGWIHAANYRFECVSSLGGDPDCRE